MVSNSFIVKAARLPGTKNDFAGSIYHEKTGVKANFNCVTRMFDIIDGVMDAQKFPSSSTETRSLIRELQTEDLKMDGKNSVAITETQQGATNFVITVKYRQNASWQGSVKWVEGCKEEKFRSALELIKMMDGVLENTIHEQ